MKKIVIMLNSLLLVIVMWSCAAKQLPPPKSAYEEGAIKVHVKADPQLNLSGGKAHTLLVCVYQLKDPNALNQLSGDEDGLYRLLECGLFDASVAAAKRLIVQPGQDTIFNLDRAEGARYVAITAGYYLLEKERMVRLYEIPVVIEKKGIIKRSKIQKLGILEIDLRLGPEQIL